MSSRNHSSLARYLANHPVNSVVSLLLLGLLAYLLVRFFEWAVIHSVVEADSIAGCRQRDTGACWAVIRERGRLVLFGLYPFPEQWRPIIACLILLAASIATCMRHCQRAVVILPLWTGSFIIFTILMGGGVLGLAPVPQANWGGLALTFYIFAAMLIVGFPLSIAFALARQSGPRWASTSVGVLVDLVRSIPLTVILFFVALVLPSFVPGWLTADKLLRVIGGFSLFFACYQSEILRGALQGLNKGQAEAAKALGLSFWKMQALVILPQAFRTALPSTVNQVVTAFKDTSYVAIIGFFDMTASASAALGTGEWATAYVEVYLVVGGLYLAFGFALARYGSYLERKSDRGHARVSGGAGQ